MSAQIFGDECMRDADGCVDATYYSDGAQSGTYGFNGLGCWMLQRFADQRGCWYVSLYIRGLAVNALAVVDDFGNLQMVQA